MKKRLKKKVSALLCTAFAAMLAGAVTTLVMPTAHAQGAGEETVAEKTFYMTNGASMRTEEPYGMRFEATLSGDKYNEITASESGADYKLGMYVFPAAYLDNANAYENGTTGDYAELKQKIEYVFYDSADSTVQKVIKTNDDGSYAIQGVVLNMLYDNYDRDYIGVGYIAKTEGDITTYEYAEFNKSGTVRSAAKVASLAYSDYQSDPAVKAVLDEIIDGAYLKYLGVTYDKQAKKYTYNDKQYDSVAEIVAERNATFTVETSETEVLMVSETKGLSATVKDDGKIVDELSKYVSWKSSNELVATVDMQGSVTAVGVGTATITASYKDVTAICSVTVKEQEALAAADYDLSKGEALTLSGISGTVTKATLNDTDITSDITQDGNNISVVYETAKNYGLGVKTLTVETENSVYTLELTIASYVISDTESWDAWYSDIAATPHNSQADLYVVVGSDFTYTGKGSTVWPSGNFSAALKGVFDGRGHVITGMKIGSYTLFSYIYGTMKNIAFKDLTSKGTNAAHGLLARYAHTGTLENVYISGTATGGITDIIATYKGNTVTVKNCIFNVTLGGTGSNLFFNTIENTPIITKFENVYAITTKTAIVNGYEGGIYASATEEFFTAVSENMSESLFSVQNGALYFNDQLILRGQEALAAADYDISKGEALTVSGISGTVTKATLNGTDITSDITQAGNNISVVYETAKNYGLGVKTLTVETENSVYTLELTIASYVISDTESWNAWYKDIAATDRTAQKALYVVVGSDFTYTGSACTVFPSSPFKGTLVGTFDGRGHVITSMKIGAYTLFSSIDGTMKNIAFKDLTSNGTNAVHGLLARYSFGGTLENVYISGTATGGITDIIASHWGGTVTVKNCIFNVTIGGTGSNLFFNANSGAKNFTNVYAITTKTAIVNGYEGGIYAAATEEFFTAVSENMSESLFSVQNNELYFGATKLL